MLKLSSYALHSAKPLMIGIKEHSTNGPLCSPNINRDMNTVNKGAELFTVSVNDTATYFRAIKPRNTTRNLKEDKSLNTLTFVCVCAHQNIGHAHT